MIYKLIGIDGKNGETKTYNIVFHNDLQAYYIKYIVGQVIDIDFKEVKRIFKETPNAKFSFDDALLDAGIEVICKNEEINAFIFRKGYTGKNINEKVLKDIFDFINEIDEVVGVIVFLNIKNRSVSYDTGRAIREKMPLPKPDSPIIFNYLDKEVKRNSASVHLLVLTKQAVF